MVRSRTLGSRLTEGAIVLFLVLLALLTLVPLVHTAAVSLSDKVSASAGLVGLWPIRPTLASYQYILEDMKFFRAFAVSLERVILGGAVNFLVTILMAFPLSREVKRFPARNIFIWIAVFALLFSPGLVPWYMTIRSLNLIDSIWALVLPTAVPLWNVILLMNFFRSVPKELDEAAVIDGAGPWTLLFQIYLPISLPALATVTLFSMVGHWNSWFDGMILMNHPENYPLITYIQQLAVVNVTELKLVEKSMLNLISDQTLNAAKLVVAIIPILLVYPFMQRYFVHGIMLGSVKE
jgi:ABC-type glycerol-3-phosphate transport system permease component